MQFVDLEAACALGVREAKTDFLDLETNSSFPRKFRTRLRLRKLVKKRSILRVLPTLKITLSGMTSLLQKAVITTLQASAHHFKCNLRRGSEHAALANRERLARRPRPDHSNPASL